MGRVGSIILILAVVGATTGAGWWYVHRPRGTTELVLYGTVDLRQVELPFKDSERIATVLVQEGERVRQGQALARLETSRLEPQIAQAEAQLEAGRHLVDKLRNGARPEEIAQARANVEATHAEVARAEQQNERLRTLSQRSDGRAVSSQDLESAQAALQVVQARLIVAQKTLDLALAGPRKEELAEAEARLRASEAQLVSLRQMLKDAELVSPVDAVVRTRIVEPGEIAFPQKPVVSLAVTDPKWVRAYVSEPNLGKLSPGMAMSVSVDSFPGRRFEGWVGFISPVAEFTPKAVQTEDLRTSLVYEVRVFVKDPSDELRLGMPATIRLPDTAKALSGGLPTTLPAATQSVEGRS
jgi:HlyD family secretion protein